MKKLLHYRILKLAVLLCMCMFWSNSQAQQYSYATMSSTYSQSFDDLGLAATTTVTGGILNNKSANLNGWYFVESGTSANTTYSAGTGSGTGGDTYSLGTASGTDRTLGSLRSGSVAPTYGFYFKNTTGSTVTSIDIAYTGETWRIGTANRIDQLDFQYSTTATSLTTGTWVDYNALDYANPGQALGSGSIQHTSAISATISGLSIANNASFFIRWVDADATSSDDAMGINNFTMKASPSGPLVTTSAATVITATGATLNASINANGTTAATSFDYGLDNTYGTNVAGSPSSISGTSATAVSATISGLSVNTQYSFRANAKVGTNAAVNGTEITFYTLANKPSAPVVSNPAIHALTVALGASDGNPAATLFAIQETTSGNYVQTGGTLAAGVVWRTAAAWSPSITVSGLTDNQTYTFHVKAKNGSGTETLFSDSTSGTTLQNVSPTVTLSAALPAFGDHCINTSSTGSFAINGVNLTSALTVDALTGYAFSLTETGTYTSTLSVPNSGTLSGQVIWVKFTPTTVQVYNGPISISGGGLAAAFNVTASGSGVNTASGVVTGGSASVTAVSATLSATTTAGCSAISAYGIEYSTSTGFADGSGTKQAGSNLSANAFSVGLSGLTPNTPYFYKAYVTDGTGTVYGTQQTFTTSNLGTPATTAATVVGVNQFTANWNALPGAASYRLDVSTSSTFGTSTSGSFNENFNTYVSAASLNGLTLEGTANYTTTGSSGLAPNSVQFNSTGDRITTQTFAGNATSLAFYLKGNGTSGGTFLVEGFDGTSWATIENISMSALNNSDRDVLYNATSTPALPANFSQFRFTYTRTAGNVAFDDLNVSYGTFTPSYVTGYNNLTVNGTSQVVSGLAENTTYYYRVRAVSGANTSSNSNATSVLTATAPTTFGGITQQAPVCDNTAATFVVTGLLASSTSTLSYTTITGGAVQTITNLVADVSGTATFTLNLTVAANAGHNLTVTAIQRNGFAPLVINSNNAVAFAVNAP
ncbi:beta strand repeat-containing protein, partial [Flavobacterium noncentrifugens]